MIACYNLLQQPQTIYYPIQPSDFVKKNTYIMKMFFANNNKIG